ncbi:MAG: signal peptidase I [Ruminococcaceae bacterium]|nr:signal peptidase I [Oscillospiraceae bacterium]
MSLYGFDDESEKTEENNVTEAEVNEVTGVNELTPETEETAVSVDCVDYSSGDVPTEDIEQKEKRRRKFEKKALKITKDVISFMLIVVLAFVAAIFINIYIIRTSNISGTSMYPTMQHGQTVLISRVPYMVSEPEKGDVIVFDSSKKARTFLRDIGEALRDNTLTRIFMDKKSPVEEETFYIKRIVGVAGDEITVKDYTMYLNGVPIEDKGYSINDDGTAYYPYEGMSWKVEEGYVFVMGDNRINSKDSRIMGTIPIDCIMGKVVKE